MLEIDCDFNDRDFDGAYIGLSIEGSPLSQWQGPQIHAGARVLLVGYDRRSTVEAVLSHDFSPNRGGYVWRAL